MLQENADSCHTGLVLPEIHPNSDIVETSNREFVYQLSYENISCSGPYDANNLKIQMDSMHSNLLLKSSPMWAIFELIIQVTISFYTRETYDRATRNAWAASQ